MTGEIKWFPAERDKVDSPNNNALREARLGVLLHYDGSSSDAGAVAWFRDPRCKVSYHWLVLDDGSYVEISDPTRRAWHAGVCRSSDPARLGYSDANSAFYGICVATDDKVDVTTPQVLTAAWLTWRCFAREGWSTSDTWRIVGHRTEAWPRGRKSDPEGADLRNPILSVSDVRSILGLFV